MINLSDEEHPMSRQRSISIAAMLATCAVATSGIASPIREGPAVSCTEGFEDIAGLTSRGWIIKNNSDPLGTTNWFQGVPARFPAQAGPADSYASADSNNASGQFPVLSDWLITPDIAFAQAVMLSFYTRELASAADATNHMEVLLCIDGGSQFCTDPGNESGSVGGFQTSLADINPSALQGGYPATWTMVTAIGLPQSGSGRLAFHYYDLAQSTNPIGTTIGVDSVTLTQVPLCPFTDVVFTNGFDGP
jgi:hypothetical protein